MGADGPGKAEIALEELLRARLFCDDWGKVEPNGTSAVQARGRLFVDDWEQASHGGEFAAAAEAGSLQRDEVTTLGDVLAGLAPGRQSDGDITLFDSTGLAIQDLAIAMAALEHAPSLDLPRLVL
jgi:ornithine cyclodeaminase/alanine dehydrogenase-like protein (mu-crystallin family)